MSGQSDSFAVLLDIAERSARTARGLPAQVDIKPHWSGIGFSLGGHRLVAPMGEVAEILVQPSSTRLPGVKSWVKGVSNVRGRLLPLIDLESFFGGSLAGGRKHHRVLALELGDLFSGLIVNEVYGMQHFPVDCFTDEIPELLQPLGPYLAGAYYHNDEVWTVFSPFRLAQSNEFFNAAAAG